MEFIDKYQACLRETDKKRAAKELSGAISNVVNCFVFRPDEYLSGISSDPDLHRSFRKLSAYWIIALCMMRENRMVDERNEYAAITASKLAGIRPVHDFLKVQTDEDLSKARKALERRPGKDLGLEPLTVYNMLTMHRTLQQTFSGLVFTFLKSEVPEINDRMEDGWERCPLI